MPRLNEEKLTAMVEAVKSSITCAIWPDELDALKSNLTPFCMEMTDDNCDYVHHNSDLECFGHCTECGGRNVNP